MEILLVIIGVAIFIRVWLSQLGLWKQADKNHKEVVNKFYLLHDVVQQRELLIDFIQWFFKNRTPNNTVPNTPDVEEYLKSIE